ncbi:MAG: hypothetical protein ACR2RB_18600 [Gammaproteobacteria bacterium]
MTALQNASADKSAVDWRSLVLDSSAEGLKLIECLAKRRFNTGVLADEAATYVLEHLSANNWQRCSQFKGNSQAKTYLQTLIVNLLEEFSRNRFGRPRPPAWLVQQGELWVKLWKELCLERQPLPALVDRYEQAELYRGSWVQQIAKVIKARIPRCGEYRFEATNVEDIAAVSDQASGGALASDPQYDAQPDSLCGYDFELRAETELLFVLRAVLQAQPCAESFSQQRARQIDAEVEVSANKLDKLRRALVLSDEEVVVPRMTYCDGLSKAAVSRALGLPAHRAGLMINSALNRIRDAVELCQLDLRSVLGKV